MAQVSLSVCFCQQYVFKMLYVSACLACHSYLFRNKDQSVAEIFKTSNIWVSFNRHISIIIHPLKAPRLLNVFIFQSFQIFQILHNQIMIWGRRTTAFQRIPAKSTGRRCLWKFGGRTNRVYFAWCSALLIQCTIHKPFQRDLDVLD